MEKFYSCHKSVMQMYIDRNSMDDDQTTFSDCYYKDPENYRPVSGGVDGWYNLLKPWRPTSTQQMTSGVNNDKVGSS